MNLTQIRSRLDNLRGEQSTITRQIDQTQENLKQYKRSLRKHERILEIVKEVGLKTQQELQYHISDITSLALEAVFEDPYILSVEFVERRGKTECDLLFERNGEKVNPIDATGGGAVDIAAFALRVASWSMMSPRSRPVMILDEPLKNLDKTRQEKGSAMIKEVSEKLGIQFIIVTHEDTLATAADKIFNVSIKKGISNISE
ncbi:MAG: hypothetical protein ACOCWM_05055 [Cyclobacteriaceae bacterium]